MYRCKCGWSGGFHDLDHAISGYGCPNCGALTIPERYINKCIWIPLNSNTQLSIEPEQVEADTPIIRS